MVTPADVVGPTEETVLALLELLVDPFLPSRSSLRHSTAPAREELVAKQVHAVVLLYNYYHRKQQQELEFLEFDSFCKLAVIMKPDILAFMKLMQRSDYLELDDLVTQLSLTEKMIMEACDICKSLDASKPSPVIEGWPIGKVAVFLVDSRKENCFLLHSSITQGVWSVIEKELYAGNYSANGTTEERLGNKKKKITKKPHRENRNADEACLQQLAFSAVKSACGISQSDLQILEIHAVYSISKEKTAARFYIMQCKQLNPEANHVAIKDIMDRLQGSLVRKEYISWRATSMVEYIHLLPYGGILTDWFSRDAPLNALEQTQAGPEARNENKEVLPNANGHLELEIGAESQEILSSADKVYSRRKRSQNNFSLCNNDDSIRSEKSAEISWPDDNEGIATMHVETDQLAPTYGVTVTNFVVHNTHAADSLFDEQEGSTSQLPLCEYNGRNVSAENISSKENEAALKALLKKKEMLSHQLRTIEDEIALCDKNILTILSGSKDMLAVKLDSIIEACNSVHLRNATSAYKKMCQKGFSRYTNKRKLFEANLDVQNPCQELDAVCYENSWILPTYCVSASHGGFTANVTIKGIDFECSSGGSMCATPQEARGSAASLVLAKLRRMASEL